MRKHYQTPHALIAAHVAASPLCASPDKDIISVKYSDNQQTAVKVEFDFTRFGVLSGSASEGRAKQHAVWQDDFEE